MTLTKTYFTYCDEDQSTIDQIIHDLGKDSVEFIHDMREERRQRETHHAMRDHKVPVWLFISDQFLRSPDALNNILLFLEDPVLSVYIQPIIVGELQDDEAYSTYWDKEYWSIRSRKDQISGSGLETYNWRVIIIRSISNEIKEFLNHLKSFKIISLDEFQRNNYEYFYETQGIEQPDSTVQLPIASPKIAEISARIAETEITSETPTLPEATIEEASPIETKTVQSPESTPIQEKTPAPTEELIAPSPEFQPSEIPTSRQVEPEAQIQETKGEPVEKGPINLPSTPIEEESEVAEEDTIAADIDPPVSDFDLLPVEILEPEEKTPVEEEIIAPTTLGISEEEQEEIFHLAISKTRKGEHREAVKLLKDILVKAPNNPKANYHYGILMQDFIGDTTEAFFHFERVIEQGTDNPDIFIRLGVLSERRDDPLLARNFYEKAIELDPQKAYTFYRLGLLIMRHFDRQLPQALGYFEQSILLSPGQANAHFHYGQLLMELGHAKKAERELRVAITLDPDHQFAYYDLAKTYLQLKKHKKATKFYHLACKANYIFETPDNNRLFKREEIGALSKTDTVKKKRQEKPTKKKEKTQPSGKKKKKAEPTVSAKEKNEKSSKKKKQKIAKKKEKTPIEQKKKVPAQKVEKSKKKKKKSSKKTVPPVKNNDKANRKTKTSQDAQKTVKKTEKVNAEAEASETPNKIALVTGATSGIGLSTAVDLAKSGFDLIITGRRELRLNKLKRKLKKLYGIKVKALAFDLRSEKAVNKAIDRLSEKWANIEILINNAGLAKGLEPIHRGNTSHWNSMIDTNIKGLLYITLAVAPGMVERGVGHIINVGSVSGREVYPRGGVYCATKHAVEALTKGMRMDFLEHGLRVSSVSPGHVNTEFAMVRYDGDEDRVAEGYKGFTPLRPEDIAEVISFIISRPPSVNIQDVLLFSSQQASAIIMHRD